MGVFLYALKDQNAIRMLHINFYKIIILVGGEEKNHFIVCGLQQSLCVM